MKLDTGLRNLVVHSMCDARINVENVLSGFVLTASGTPYSEFIVEWTYSSYMGEQRKLRELVVVSNKDTEGYLQDLMEDREREGYLLTGICPLYQISLPKPLF